MFQQNEESEETSFNAEPLIAKDDEQISLTCQLCSQYLCCATETVCNHIFCEGCLNDYLLYLNQCPQCQAKIRGEVSFRNKLLDNVIIEYIKTSDHAELDGFNLRLQRHNSFKRNSKVQKSKFVKGLEVDILDQNHIWCTGKILKVIDLGYEEEEIQKLLVKYDNSRKKQEIQISSSRLAIKGSYTSRKQIPHYHRKKVVFEQNGMLMEATQWDYDKKSNYSRMAD